jgi:hypothetical protein
MNGMGVHVSPNGRYFVDGDGAPFFWLGDTQWELFRVFTPDDAEAILRDRKGKGFSVVQVMLTGVGDGTRPNLEGQTPWENDDPASPSKPYFERVDAVLRMGRESGLVFALGIFHQLQASRITTANARAYAGWLARRYGDEQHIIWTMYPQAKREFVPVIRELATGLQEGDGGAHMIAVHPDPAPYSSSFIHGESWLAFNQIQTWRDVGLIYPMVTNDYGLKPVKPVVMAEGAYEDGTEYGFEVNPLWIRRQAYYSYLAGGHHSYGHNDSWRVLSTWRGALDAPGACQMGVLRKALMDRGEWWSLVPDQSIFVGGGQTSGDVLNLAARHKGGKWAMAYLASKSSFSVDLGKITGGREVNASWVDPRTGGTIPIGVYANEGVRPFTTPDGWEDALLVMESQN